MGKLRIKKKEAVLAFRQTYAYRFIILAFTMAVFLFSAYQMVVSLVARNATTFVIATVLAGATSLSAYFNMDRLKEAKVPKKTIQRMKRR